MRKIGSTPRRKAAPVRLPGAHRVIRRRPDKVVIDWYPWRGKGAPRVISFSGRDLAAAERAEAADLAAIAAAVSRVRS